MKCTYCGGELPAGAGNCPHCGAACSENTAPQQTMMQQSTQPQQASAQQPQLSWWGKIWSQSRMARKDFWIFWLLLTLVGGVGSETVVIPIFLFIFEITIWSHRLHDTNRSAWNLLWILTLIGVIIPIIICCQKGTEGPNRFGNEPQRIF